MEAPEIDPPQVDERVPRDVGDVADAVRRLIVAVRKRAQGGDLEALTELLGLAALLGPETEAAVGDLHHEHGYTWAEIGRAAGISRQAAQQRWGD